MARDRGAASSFHGAQRKQLRRLKKLSGGSIQPQYRGRAFEDVLYDIAHAEDLQPIQNIVSTGEQIDLAIVVDGQHYLLECKWTASPVGLPTISAFSAKVARKAEGTFGVLVSMSGFVQNVNRVAARGMRLNCIGMSRRHVIAILEGRTTFARELRRSRALASMKSQFLNLPP